MRTNRCWVVAAPFLAGALCAALASCSVGDEPPEPEPQSEEEAYCGPYPHFAWTGYECLPSCGAAGGTSCNPSACVGHDTFRSWDCDVCCAPAPDECQANDTRCEGNTVVYCDTHADPNRIIRFECGSSGGYGPEFDTCVEFSDDYADCVQQ